MIAYVHTEKGLSGTVELTDNGFEGRRANGSYPWPAGPALAHSSKLSLEMAGEKNPSNQRIYEALVQSGNGYYVVRDHHLTEEEHESLFSTPAPFSDASSGRRAEMAVKPRGWRNWLEAEGFIHVPEFSSYALHLSDHDGGTWCYELYEMKVAVRLVIHYRWPGEVILGSAAQPMQLTAQDIQDPVHRAGHR